MQTAALAMYSRQLFTAHACVAWQQSGLFMWTPSSEQARLPLGPSGAVHITPVTKLDVAQTSGRIKTYSKHAQGLLPSNLLTEVYSSAGMSSVCAVHPGICCRSCGSAESSDDGSAAHHSSRGTKTWRESCTRSDMTSREEEEEVQR